MNKEQFLESGIIEEYCLGLASPKDVDLLMTMVSLYPEISEYLSSVQLQTNDLLTRFQRPASHSSKEIIKRNIRENLKLRKALLKEQPHQLEEFISISRHTDIEMLESLIAKIHPPEEYDNIHLEPLYIDSDKMLAVVWVKDQIPEEKHELLDESFLILEGNVSCHIDNEVFYMEKGMFMRMPLKSEHSIKVTSSYPAKAILSHVNIADD